MVVVVVVAVAVVIVVVVVVIVVVCYCYCCCWLLFVVAAVRFEQARRIATADICAAAADTLTILPAATRIYKAPYTTTRTTGLIVTSRL